MTERLITVRDVSLILGVSEKEVLDLAEEGKIPAYKIGGVYLRFKPEQIEEFRRRTATAPSPKDSAQQQRCLKDSISDFLYFNDFYLISILIILVILFIIFRG